MTDDRESQALKRLAGLAVQRRADLDMTKMDAAHKAEVSINTYMKLEDGRPLRETTYAKIENAFGWAPSSCRAVLDGASEAIVVERGPGGTVIARIPEEDLGQAVTSAIVAVSDSLTAPEIRDMSRRVVEELKRRGLLED